MNTGSFMGALVSKDINRSYYLKPLDPGPSQRSCHVLEDVSLDELGNSLTEFLHIKDDQKVASNSIVCQPSRKTNNCDVEEEDECEDPDQTESTIVTSDKCLSKCATFPFSGKKASLAASTDEEGENDITSAVLKQSTYKSFNPAHSRSISLPPPIHSSPEPDSGSDETPLKLVSAMKGSREKQGIPPKKLTVTWAPDVYDPPPSTSISTFVRIKKPQSKNGRKKNYDGKRNGKKKQKGKPHKGGGGGSSKQVWKCGGSRNKCYEPLDDIERVVDCNESYGGSGDFDVGIPDSYCGSSFLKKSVTKVHFSVAEAT